MPWINGQSGGTRIANGGGLVVVNADGSITITPATGTGVLLGVAPPATATRALFQIGNGPTDGVTAGHYTGSASGGGYGANFASGYAGDTLNLQVAGVPVVLADAQGTLSLGGSGFTGTLKLFRSTGVVTGQLDCASGGPRLLDTGGAGLSLASSLTVTIGGIVATAGSIPLTVTGVALQTGDLIRMKDSAGHAQFAVMNAGTGAAPVWALRVRAVANAESMVQLHTAGANTGRAIQIIDDAGTSLGWLNLTA